MTTNMGQAYFCPQTCTIAPALASSPTSPHAATPSATLVTRSAPAASREWPSSRLELRDCSSKQYKNNETSVRTGRASQRGLEEDGAAASAEVNDVGHHGCGLVNAELQTAAEV